MNPVDESDAKSAGARSAPADPWALLAALGEVVRVRGDHKPGDPELARAFTECLAVWQSELARTGSVEVEVHPHGFVFGETGQVLPPGGLNTLYDGFVERDLRWLCVESEIDAEAFAGLVEVLACEPAALEAEGGVVAALAARVPFGMSARSRAVPVDPAPDADSGPDFTFESEAIGEDTTLDSDLAEPEKEDDRIFDDPLASPEFAAEAQARAVEAETAPSETPDAEPLPPLTPVGAPQEDEGPVIDPFGSLDGPVLSDQEADALGLGPESDDTGADLDDLDLELDESEAADELGDEFALDLEGSAETEAEAPATASGPLEPAAPEPEAQALGSAADAPLEMADEEAESEGFHEPDAVSLDDSGDELGFETGSESGEDLFERGDTPELAADETAAPAGTAESPPADDEVFALLRSLDESEETGDYGDHARRVARVAGRAAQEGRTEEAYQVMLVLSRHAAAEDRPERQRQMARECLHGLAGDQRAILIERACTLGEESGVDAAQVLLQLGDLVVPDLLQAAVKEREPERLAQLHGLLITLGERCLPDLMRSLEGGDPATVRTAVRLIGETQNPEAIPRLGELLVGSESSVRQEAAKALVRIGSKEAIERVVALLESDLPGMPEVAIHSLASSGSAAPVEPMLAALRSAVESGQFDRARDLIRGLGRLGRPETTPDLAALLLRKSLLGRRRLRELKLAVAAALAGIPGDDAVGALAQAAQSRDAQLRRAAQTALDRRAHALARRGEA